MTCPHCKDRVFVCADCWLKANQDVTTSSRGKEVNPDCATSQRDADNERNEWHQNPRYRGMYE